MATVKRTDVKRNRSTADAILDAAEQLMVVAAQIDEVSTRRVAERAGVSVCHQFAWWIAVFPGAIIFGTTLSLCLLGDWLRDRRDPAVT